jgi:3-oxoacyl-[acyl-carrier protein] reductase
MARRGDLLEGVAGEIASTGGAKPVLIVEDFMQEGSPERVARAALDGLGAVDILVNNAGGSRPFKIDAGEEQWNEAMTLNFTRQRQLTHELLDQMMARKWGRILNITGKSEPDGINGAFCAKAAIHSWAKGLSRDVGKHGITVNCLPPGRINSEQIRRNYTPEYRQWQADNEIPVGRYGEPEDIANLVCYLASPLAGYISGTVIPVDGGLRRYQF